MQLQHPSVHTDRAVEPIRSAVWREAARCRGSSPAVFFPAEDEGPEAQRAKAICAACAVRKECLEEALAAREQFGIWGGTTPRERRRIERMRRKTA
jgi:WhiB family redox-sensing transcriptional regulator